jgi:lysozyme family protein
MKTPFERAVARLFTEEGGFVDDPRDPGGATNMGITLRVLREVGWDIDGDGDIDADDIRLLPRESAVSIARDRYWSKCRCEELPSLTNELVFDFAYHSGPTAAIKALQRACGASEDGAIGNETITKSLGFESREMAARYMAERQLFLVAARDPRDGSALWPTYGKGWSRRLFRLAADVARTI